MAHHTNAAMHECIDRCQTCQESCLENIPHCLQKGGKHAAPEHIGLLAACAEICDTSARFMLLGSTFHTRVCEVCADVCEACAKECDSFGDDEMMQAYADACRRCADSCRDIASTATRA